MTPTSLPVVWRTLRSVLLLVPLLGVALCAASVSAEDADASRAELKDAYELYERGQLEKLIFTTDPLERGDVHISAELLRRLAGEKEYEMLFALGDEAFEAELDEVFGMGLGATTTPGDSTVLKRRRLLGSLGGLDSGSCRACHFKGGPDGSGTFSSVAVMRSDGTTLSSGILRDAPHVMGVGYIEIVANEMTAKLQRIAAQLQDRARQSGTRLEQPLEAKGVSFGVLAASANGVLDLSGVRHVAPDLIVRPFGHKGRARTLVEFTDEAMQMHHGLQTTSRLDAFSGHAQFIGDGPAYDADKDGVAFESSAAQPVVLAAYLSMLPIPEIHPPRDADLALAWGRGRALFAEIGCVDCHVPQLRFESDEITHVALGDSTVRLNLALSEVGQEPVPRRIDYGADESDTFQRGTPIFAFTDLRLHDLGPDLADRVGEPLADGSWEVPREFWLTRSLWGLADTAPYLHDGRAATFADAIRYHGGEASASRTAFQSLTETEQRSVFVFLRSLTRARTVLVE